MTKIIIDVSKCEYKNQNKENYNGKPYCTCLNKLCEDISFVCDKNCQVFEDLKQLARANEENEMLKSQITSQDCEIYNLKSQLQAKEQLSVKQSHELIRLRKELQENKQKNANLLQENEELKKQLDKYLNQEEEEIRQLNNDNKLDDILESIKKANVQLEKESKYKQALDEIENLIKNLGTKNILTFPDLSLQENIKAVMGQCNSGYEDILGIINKAKEQ